MSEEQSTPESGMTEGTPELGTTAKLFPHLMEEVAPPPKEEPKPPEPEPEAAAPPQEEKPAEAPKVLTVDELGDQLVKVKIDGVEKEVPFRDVLRGYQTDQHLTAKGQKIAKEKQDLESMKRQTGGAQPPAQPTQVQEVDPLLEVLQPYIKPFQEKISQLEKTLEDVAIVTKPALYQANLHKVDTYLKGQGFDDFMAYVPKIESHILSLPEEEQAQYDNQFAYIDLYKTQKLREKVATPPQTPRHVDQRPAPPVTKIESVSGTPTGTDDFQARYKTAFERAKETNDWTEVLKLKGAL